MEEKLEAFSYDFIGDLYNMMLITQGVEQEEQYHPEGDPRCPSCVQRAVIWYPSIGGTGR